MGTTPPLFAANEFRKATRSRPNQSCVMVARRAGWVELRDSKTTFDAADDHRLVFTAEEFDAYLTSTRAGETEGHSLEIKPRADATYLFRRRGGTTELTFTQAEVDAFNDGITQHEFDTTAYTT